MEKAKLFFEKFLGIPANNFTEIPQSGSGRTNYIAETNEKKYIVTYNLNSRENESFFYFSQVFSDLQLATPKILCISDDRLLYIQEFLGEKTLSQIIESEGLSDRVKQLVHNALDQLFLIQNKTKDKIDYTHTLEYTTYNQLPILHDLYYFKFLFLDVLEVDYHRSSLLLEFQKLADRLANISPRGIMLRDFQSRNILVNDFGSVSFIDYQSAMEGPLVYDLVSFLYQAKANFPESFRQDMIHYYISNYSDEVIKKQIEQSILPIRLIRSLQVLGAYGFRGLVQKKDHFIKSIPNGIKNLKEVSIIWEEMKQYPNLYNIINQL